MKGCFKQGPPGGFQYLRKSVVVASVVYFMEKGVVGQENVGLPSRLVFDSFKVNAPLTWVHPHQSWQC